MAKIDLDNIGWRVCVHGKGLDVDGVSAEINGTPADDLIGAIRDAIKDPERDTIKRALGALVDVLT